MKKIIFLVLLIFLSITKAISQNNLPPVYEIKTDTSSTVRLEDAYWQMLEDPEGKWTIDDVSRPPLAEKFHANTTSPKAILGIDYSVKTFWFRYRFKNSMKKEVRITIPKNSTYCDFYTPGSDGSWSQKITGTSVPWSKRDDLKRITTATYTIQPEGELLIYERNNYDYFINTPDYFEINFGFTDKAIPDYFNNNDLSVLPSFLFGIFLLAALFNLYFFLIVRGRVYLFFSLTLFFRGFSRFLWANDVFFREHPVVKSYLAYICGGLFFFFLIHFLRYFFETFKYFPRWDKYLIGVSIYIGIFFFLIKMDIIPFEYADLIGPAVVLLSILITFILFLRSDVKAVKFPIVAALPVICIMWIPSFVVLFKILNEYTGMPVPSLLKWVWVNNRFAVLEQIGLVWLLIFFSWSLFQRYQQLQKKVAEETLAKERLAKEKEMERSQLIAQQKVELEKQVTERTTELKQSLEYLKSTQVQLVQQEKMASLGELTAGIAHEIQNPLNFVNNFSEVNAEMIDEMTGELAAGNSADAINIAAEIKENNLKIAHHGKRADSIVKSMLQHSRASTGEKEATDINALVDECLRLSYHGLRAKDKMFNAKLETHLDPSAGTVNIVQQDISRVLLNLFNNALYSVTEKKKQLNGAPSAGQAEFEPTVSVSTKQNNGKVEVRVRDNGLGIQKNVLDKIYQPFFTTKPPGEGTGLGLSLSYDIIKKGHSGDLKVNAKEGEFAEFIVELPS